MDSLELTKRAVCALDNKKAANIEALRVDDVTILGDYLLSPLRIIRRMSARLPMSLNIS